MNTILQQLGLNQTNSGSSTGSDWFANGKEISSYTPVDGSLIASVTTSTDEDYEKVIQKASEAFKTWRMVPAPKRGEIVRQVGEALRENKEALGDRKSTRLNSSHVRISYAVFCLK